MATNQGASGSDRSDKESPSNAMLLSEWRKYKKLRNLAKNPNLTEDQRAAFHKQALIQKHYLFRFYIDDACLNAYSHWKRKIPKKSSLTADDAIQVVIARLLDNMEEFDPDFAREEDWLKPENNMFMMWFNSAPVMGQPRSRLLGAINDELRSLMHFPRKTPEELREFNEGMSRLRQKLGKNPTLEEYLDEYGWDKIKKVKNPLLHSQVFNQSNSRPGEHVDQELRFDGDRRRQEAEPEVSLTQATNKISERMKREEQLMSMIPQEECRLPFIAYYFWKWNIPTIARRFERSNTLISKRITVAEQHVEKYFGNRARMMQWIAGDLDIPELNKPLEKSGGMTLPTPKIDFS